MDRATRNIAFIEQLHITAGLDAGKRFLLRDWQKRFIQDVYSPIRADGKRAVRRAILSMGRKNGKTELAAAIILLHLIGPEAEPNGEVYSAANDRQQAAMVFNAVKRMINAEPALKKHLTIVDSTKRIFVRSGNITASGSVFQALSAEVTTKLGFNPSCIVYDELAQSKKRHLFDALATSQGARSEPLLMVISTQSNDPTHVLSELIVAGLSGQDPSTVCHLYAAKEGCGLMDEAEWYKANPALGDFLDLLAFRDDAARAVSMPASESAFRNYQLNQQVSPFSTLIAREDWKACGPTDVEDWSAFKEKDSIQFEPGESIYVGLDMSMRTDLTALVMVSADDTSRAKAIYWKPQAVLLPHTDRDRFRYDLFHKNGWLETTPGRSIDPAYIAQKIATIHARNPIRGLAYDRYLTEELLRCLDNIGLTAQDGEGDGLRIVAWGQGFKDMSPAVAAMEAAVVNEELKHDGNPITTFCMMNSQVTTDAAGNRKLDKSASRFRIDGAVALAMALGLKARDRMPTGEYESTLFSEGFDYKSLYA